MADDDEVDYIKQLSLTYNWSPKLEAKYVKSPPFKVEKKQLSDETVHYPNSLASQDEFTQAAVKGDMKMLLILTPKVVIDKMNSDGKTALIASVLSEQIKVVRFLLAKGANPNILDEKGNSAVHYAVTQDNSELLEMLLDKCDVNTKNRQGQTPLHLVVQHMKCSFIDLLKNRAKLCVNEKDSHGNTVVHLAVMQKDYQTVLSKILSMTVDVSIYNDEGFTAVNLAVNEGKLEALQMLVESIHGKNAENLATQYGESNLQLAIRIKQTAIADYLLNRNPTVSCTIDQKYGFTPLHWAVLQKNDVFIERLLILNPKLINVKDGRGNIALEHVVNIHECSRVPKVDLINIAIKLILEGADMSAIVNQSGLQKLIRDTFQLKFKT